MKFDCRIRYMDDRGRSQYVNIESDLADRRYIEQLVRARYPAKQVYINLVKQA